MNPFDDPNDLLQPEVSEKPKKITNKKSDKEITKKVSTLKSRVKMKLYETINLFEELKNINVPTYLLNSIKETNINLNDIDKTQQKATFDFFKKHRKEKLLILLLINSQTIQETSFTKNTILNKKYIDFLFRNFNIENLN